MAPKLPYCLPAQSRCELFVGLCSDRPCQNEAKCSPHGQDDYVCACKDGFTGKFSNFIQILYLLFSDAGFLGI